MKISKIFFVLGLSGLLTTNAYAAGYELLEQSAEGVGQAFSGSATGYGDGSEVYFNPGAMSLISKDTASAHVHFIIPKADFNNEGSAYIPALGSTPLIGDNGGDGGGLAVVPNIYGVWKASNDVTFGLGVNSPFGLATEYDDGWVGRYHAIKSELMTVNINPAVSFKASDMLALGVGLQIMHAEAELTNAIDFGTIGVSTLGLPTAASLGLLPQAADGFGKVEGDDWGLGVGVGGVITPAKGIRIGVNWRSKIDLTLDGDADFTVPTNALPLTSTGAFTDTDAQAKVTLPESLNIGIAADVDDSVTLYADGAWTRWERFEELRITYDSVQPDTVQDESWQNVWRASLGAKMKVDDKLSVKAGVSWDEAPTPDAEHRTPRIPDADRFWLALGLNYDVTEATSIGIGYAHIFVKDVDTNVTSSTGSTLTGSWDLGVDIASVNLVTNF